MNGLTDTQLKMIACSLEIDGRADTAATSVVGGGIWDFLYDGKTGEPTSPKAVELKEVESAIAGMIFLLGLAKTITALREHSVSA